MLQSNSRKKFLQFMRKGIKAWETKRAKFRATYEKILYIIYCNIQK